MIRIEWFVVFILIVAFREIYGFYSKKPNNYDSGYHDSINDIVDVWNKGCEKNARDFEGRISELYNFLQRKLDER